MDDIKEAIRMMKGPDGDSKYVHHAEQAEKYEINVDYMMVKTIDEFMKFTEQKIKGIPELESSIKYIEDIIKDTYESAKSCDLYLVMGNIAELSRAITLTEKELTKRNISALSLTLPIHNIIQDMYLIFKDLCKCQLKEKKLSIFEAAETTTLL
jgi:hypothetical protein